MIKLTNNPKHQQQIVYVDRPVITEQLPVEVKTPDAIILEKEVIRHIEVPVYRDVIVEKDAAPVDLSPIKAHLSKHEQHLALLTNRLEQIIKTTEPELELQRRALVAIKTQRDIDRSRRLLLIKRLKEEKKAVKKLELKLKLAISVSILIAIVSLFVKL